MEILALMHGIGATLAAGLMTAVALKAAERRQKTQHGRAATWMFVWWASIAGALAILGVFSLVGAFAPWPFALFMAFTEVYWLLLIAALCSLTMALLYVVTGRHQVWIPVVSYYLVIYLFLQYTFAVAPPDALVVRGGISEPDYGAQDLDVDSVAVLSAFMALPVLGAILLYAGIYAKAPDATSRYRIGMSVTAFLLFLVAHMADILPEGWSFSMGAASFEISGLPQIAEGTMFALAGWSAYLIDHPVKWMRRRLDASVEEEASQPS